MLEHILVWVHQAAQNRQIFTSPILFYYSAVCPFAMLLFFYRAKCENCAAAAQAKVEKVNQNGRIGRKIKVKYLEWVLKAIFCSPSPFVPSWALVTYARSVCPGHSRRNGREHRALTTLSERWPANRTNMYCVMGHGFGAGVRQITFCRSAKRNNCTVTVRF